MKISASRLLWSRDYERGRLRHVGRLIKGGHTVVSIARYPDNAWLVAYVDHVAFYGGTLQEAKSHAERMLFGDA